MQQRSPEWYAARLGKVGASRIADLMARTKSGYSTSRDNYMAELICERLTGVNHEGYLNSAMQWGIDNEATAKNAYSFMTDYVIEEAGFIDHPTIAMAGCSPDGLIGDDGLIECKCPITSTHLGTLISETIEGKYQFQMQFQMAVTGRAWCDFVSFDPRLPGEMQLWMKRVRRDDMKIKEIETGVSEFLAEMDAKIATLRARYLQDAAA